MKVEGYSTQVVPTDIPDHLKHVLTAGNQGGSNQAEGQGTEVYADFVSIIKQCYLT